MGLKFLPPVGYLLGFIMILAITALAAINQPKFGKLPRGERLKRIQESPHYRGGKFQNSLPTPKFSTDDSFLSVVWSGLFGKAKDLVPDSPIPTVKTDLKALVASGADTVVWLGHSSWLILAGGKRILVDPVFSYYAAPFSFINRAFEGTTIYDVQDMPKIDCLLISHDHYDHLDYPTAKALESKVDQVICPLGVGAYFEAWGYAKEKIREGEWQEKISLGRDVTIHVLPARHYSGRLFKENKTFWAAFAIQTPDRKIFYSGDSGYGPHFSQIGDAFQGFDLEMLDCGQYDPRWAYIHMTPKEADQAARDLGAKAFIPSHVGRFCIADHPWHEPFKQLAVAANLDKTYALLTPKIGEPVDLDHTQKFSVGALEDNVWTSAL